MFLKAYTKNKTTGPSAESTISNKSTDPAAEPTISNKNTNPPAKPTISEDLIVQRAANILQVAFLDFREITFDACIGRVEIQDNEFRLFLDSRLGGLYNGLYFPFPAHLVSSDKDKMALLSHKCGHDTYGFFTQLIRELLDCTKFDIEETQVILKQFTRLIISVGSPEHSAKRENGHFILKITSKTTKNSWAIDMTGPQFNIYSSSMPWDKYVDKYCEKIVFHQRFGTLALWTEKLATLKGHNGVFAHIMQETTVIRNMMIEKWKHEMGINLAALLELEKNEYKRARTKLLKVLRDAETIHIHIMDHTDSFEEGRLFDLANPGYWKEAMRAIAISLSGNSAPDGSQETIVSAGDNEVGRYPDVVMFKDKNESS